MNITEALLTALKERGAREVFGIPGDFALPYFKIMEESQILPLITMSHEPSIGFAADAAVRFGGGLGVVAVTYGAGALNVLNPIAQAYAEKSPVVVISGAPASWESERGLLIHHQAKTVDSQARMFKEVTCDQVVLDNPETAPQLIHRALQSCIEYSRPVYIEIPRDNPAADCLPVPTHAPLPVNPDALRICAQDVLAHIKKAKKPVLMVGVEVRRYGLEKKVRQLAELLGLPVITSFMGRGQLTDYPLLMGTYLGIAGKKEIADTMENSDAMIYMGIIFSDTNFGVSESRIDKARTIRMDERNVSLGYHIYHEIPLPALLDEILLLLEGEAPVPPPKMHKCVTYKGCFISDQKEIHPDDIAVLINDHFRHKEIMPLAADVGDCLFTTLAITPVPIAAPGYYVSMGFGVPAGMAVQISTGKRSLTLVGDGAFQMTGMELGNCPRLGIDPLVIVFNNGTWEMLRLFQPGSRFNYLGRWDYAGLADSLGGKGYRVSTRKELAEAFNTACSQRGKFQLIDVTLPEGSVSTIFETYANSFQNRK
ncbi:MAG: indolepyruvate/phenylpyruvate decarboxylase [bacterium]|nr:indolepyruvate/phenylpyruvate decarboxylase [bacterium]